jgi:catechol 2,3-dioxygenase-like lactoylglutathione lyase family enzyme
MIEHASVSVSDYQKNKELYRAMLAPLGYAIGADMPDYKAAGFKHGDRQDFWIGQKDGKGGGTHVAFAADNKGMVEAFYEAGIGAGGADNGAPGYRKDNSPGYYAAFVHDYDGNNIEVVWHDPNPPAA